MPRPEPAERGVLPRFALHPEGLPFVGGFALVTVILFLIWAPLGWIALLATLWCAYFFRDPDRVTPARSGLMVAPADGIVLPMADGSPPPELGLGEAPRLRVSIFMNVFDVHVNRSPVDGRVERITHRRGRFVHAAADTASSENERSALRISLDDGREIAVVQIAGLVARRIRTTVREGETLLAGHRIGIIRFGSRVDVYLPPGVAAQVLPGQRVVAGETVIADLASTEPTRTGGIR